MASIIPEVLNHFNIYNGANALVGVSGEVELPELEAITDTVEGTGVLGEIEDPVTGQFSSATIKIPFAVLYSDMFSIVNTTEPPLLTLRADATSASSMMTSTWMESRSRCSRTTRTNTWRKPEKKPCWTEANRSP